MGKKNAQDNEKVEYQGDDEKVEYHCSKGQISLCRKDYPKHVFFILGNEFCERFCFYGMRAVLQSYLMLKLGQDIDTAASLYHAFAIVSYFTPLPGAILADSYLGKYWTIVSLSIVYVFGNIIMSTSAIGPGYYEAALVGMFTIAVGTGGIKPCVSSFGGEQFSERQVDLQKAFFSMFYIAINTGSVLSQIITPILKSTPCFGDDACWVLAFGLPAALMVVAVILFLVGTPLYTKKPVTGNIAVEFGKAVGIAIGRSCSKDKGAAEHWLDRAVPDFSQQFVDDCKAVMRVLVLFLPLPFFWALFDQTGSRWTYQAQKMNTYIDVFDIHLEAEQIQIFNGIMIVCLVPIFDSVVYPIFAKCNLLKKPLQRIVGGCFLAGVSFIVMALLQYEVQDATDIVSLHDTTTHRTTLFNTQSDCKFDVSYGKVEKSIEPYGFHNVESAIAESGTEFTFTNIKCGTNFSEDVSSFSFNASTMDERPLSSMYFNRDYVVMTYGNNTFPMKDKENEDDPDEFLSEQLFQIIIASYTPLDSSVVKSMRVVKGGFDGAYFAPAANDPVALLQYTILQTPSENYRVEYVTPDGEVHTSQEKLYLLQGGSYIAYMLPDENEAGKFKFELIYQKKPNTFSVYWQAIPYFILTCAEILFSITGLSFAYSQAPDSMKSILAAGWLLTASFGNVIDLIIVLIQIPDKAAEFFMFAGLMIVVTFIFAIMAYFYKYVEEVEQEKAEQAAKEGKEIHTPGHHVHPIAAPPSIPYLTVEEKDDVKKAPYDSNLQMTVISNGHGSFANPGVQTNDEDYEVEAF